MSPPTRLIKIAVPLQDIEEIDGPVGELSIPRQVADRGFAFCSTWVTEKLLYLSNEIGRRGVAVISSKTEFFKDGDVSQIIRLYGVRINEYVLMEDTQYEATLN